MKSADFLSARSQPFAAVLCEATAWTIDREPERAKQVYQRYLHQGAHVAWGRSFGRTCPQPDFAEVSMWSKTTRQLNRLAQHARAHPVYAALAAVLALAIVTGSAFYLRRKNA
jgi:hypothetical protein